MLFKSILLTLVTLISISCHSQKSELWENFKLAQNSGTEPILPNFSYAGYKYSEKEIPLLNYKIFDVTSYGAVPNDIKSDKKAIKKAIEAATKNGEGIIYFPRGKYYINTKKDDQTIIKIASSKIIFRGEGDKTTLFFEQDLPPLDPKKLWTCPSAIKVTTDKKNEILTTVIANARRETHTIKVKNTSNIKKGDWVILKVLNNSKEIIEKDLLPIKLNPKWKSIISKGVKVNEIHQVANVKEHTITFIEPIHYDIESKHNWMLTSFNHLQHVGFENLIFEGNWLKKFVHHRSAQDDGGWSILNISKTVNSWIKNCTFKNVSRCASISSSAACTAININIEGNIGHSAIHTHNSTGILMANINDKAGMHHSIGVDGGSTACVIWRSKYASHTSFESHASQPRCTLFDNVEGGFFQGRAGGSIKNLPNHGRHLVLWNFKETDKAEKDFCFIAKNSQYWRIVPPIIVGFHGAGTTFNEDEVQVIESLGKPVTPESLFEEQLKLRLGKLPEWIHTLKKPLKQ